MACSRRRFLQHTLAAAAALPGGSLLAQAVKRSATDWVTLGKSGVKVTRLAFGTGTTAAACSASSGRSSSPAWSGTLRPRHPLLRNRRELSRNARDARDGAEGHPARQLPADDEVQHAPMENPRRRSISSAASQHGLLRHPAAALRPPADWPRI